MTLIDVKEVQSQAKKELVEERMEIAKEKLKELYTKAEKARLVVRNIDREIDNYLQEVGELTTYEAAGVDTDTK